MSSRSAKTYKALYAFDSVEEDELTLIPGDLVDVEMVHEGEWGLGRCRRTQKDGSFPWSYVELLKGTTKAHAMVLIEVAKPLYCYHCGDFVWGAGKQAYKCTQCDFYCHKACKFFVDNNSALECLRNRPGPAIAAAPVETWTLDDVRLWLHAVKLAEYEFLFVERNIDGRALAGLRSASLQEMGVTDPAHLAAIDACVSELVRGDARKMDGEFATRVQAAQSLRNDLLREADELPSTPLPADARLVHVVKGHQFRVKTFCNPAWCDECRNVLWGLARQGLQCTACGYNTHHACLDLVPPCQPQRLALRPLAPLPPGMQTGLAFGGTLEDHMAGGQPPLVVLWLLQALDAKLATPRLYRTVPAAAHARALRETMLKNPDARTFAAHDAHALAWALRRYFADLAAPIIPETFHGAILRDMAQLPTVAAQVAALDTMVAQFPAANQTVLGALLAHLGRVTTASESNRADAPTLAHFWAGTLLRPADESLPFTLGTANAAALAVQHLILKCQCGGIPGAAGAAPTPPPLAPRGKKPAPLPTSTAKSYENVSIAPKPVAAPRPAPPPRPQGSGSSVYAAVYGPNGVASGGGAGAGLDSFPWYAGPMERAGADVALKGKSDGAFLIRKSTSHAGFSLSVKYREIRHILIVFSKGMYGFSEPTTFATLPELIAHFQKTSLAGYNAELETKLVYPFKTAPQQSSAAADDANFEEPDEELYMTNREALKRSLGVGQQPLTRPADFYSSRVKDLQRKLKAHEMLCGMLREQRKLAEAQQAGLTDRDRAAVEANYAALVARLRQAETELTAITRDVEEETRRERESEDRAQQQAQAQAPLLPPPMSPAAAQSHHPAVMSTQMYVGGTSAGGGSGSGGVDGVPLVEASPYYVGVVPRPAAEQQLEGLPDGTYLVRKSERPGDPFTMSMRFRGETKHIQIKSSRNAQGVMCYGLADPPPFPSLDELCRYYAREKLSATISTTLTRPVKQVK